MIGFAKNGYRDVIIQLIKMFILDGFP